MVKKCTCGRKYFGRIHDASRKLLIGKICLRNNLPAGDPCWMAAKIGSYVGCPLPLDTFKEICPREYGGCGNTDFFSTSAAPVQCRSCDEAPRRSTA